MSTIEEIEYAIENLPPNEYARLSEWMQSRLADEWDASLAADAEAGRLDFLFTEAEAEASTTQLRDWPSNRQ